MKNTLLTLILALLTIATAVAQDEMFDICPIKLGEECPSAELFSLDGESVDLEEIVGEKPTVIVVYRGGWCPYCMRHLSALQEAKEEIETLGFQMVTFSPDDYSKLDTTYNRSGLEYQLYSDKNVSAIKALGLDWHVNDKLYAKYRNDYKMDTEFWSGEDHHILPVPAVLVFYKGKLRYQHIDPKYSQRLDPDVLIAMLKSLVRP